MISDRFWLVIYGVCKACLFFWRCTLREGNPSEIIDPPQDMYIPENSGGQPSSP